MLPPSPFLAVTHHPRHRLLPDSIGERYNLFGFGISGSIVSVFDWEFTDFWVEASDLGVSLSWGCYCFLWMLISVVVVVLSAVDVAVEICCCGCSFLLPVLVLSTEIVNGFGSVDMNVFGVIGQLG